MAKQTLEQLQISKFPIKAFVDYVDNYLYSLIHIIFRTNMKLIDESETDIDDENQTVINNVHDYHSVFKPNRTCKYSYFI